MQTYQVRKRVFMLQSSGARLRFPNQCVLRFVLSPQTPFGGSTVPSRTGAAGITNTVTWNANTDRDWVVMSDPLDPVAVDFAVGDATADFEGNVLTYRRKLHSRNELTAALERMLYRLPLALNVEFIDAPVITEVTGRVGDAEFVYQHAKRASPVDLTNQQRQIERLTDSWGRVQLLRHADRRVVAALHYFHVACRLERAGHTPWEFMAEVLLNYTKLLEVLFPNGDKTIDGTRMGAQQLGFTSAFVDEWFVPALSLRNDIDVAHVSLADFEPDQLAVLHTYTERAERHFRDLLRRVMAGVADKTFNPPSAKGSGHTKASKIIERMRAAQVASSQA
ncbi:hypothetical protein AB0B31_15180 [Catellatospora citrea]|uniref:hypothetical protein n=1 Tax=Catellatospora citrea TaxID=53366 RepID=UPI0033C5AE16